MNDNAFWVVVMIIIFAVGFNALVAYGERRSRTNWRRRKTNAKKRIITHNQ